MQVQGWPEEQLRSSVDGVSANNSNVQVPDAALPIPFIVQYLAREAGAVWDDKRVGVNLYNDEGVAN